MRHLSCWGPSLFPSCVVWRILGHIGKNKEGLVFPTVVVMVFGGVYGLGWFGTQGQCASRVTRALRVVVHGVGSGATVE